jgi:MSHA biogenesis protein MshL
LEDSCAENYGREKMMTRKIYLLITCVCFLASCASPQNVAHTQQIKQTIDDELEAASQVVIPETEMPSSDILDELMPEAGSITDLSDDIEREATFDISVSNAPAKLFFMSLVKDTEINMVVHPSVAGEISLDLKNVTVLDVMNLSREVYGYEFKASTNGYIVLPARIQSKIFAVNYLNVNRSGESSMTVSSGQLGSSTSSNSSDDDTSTSNTTSNTSNSSSINTSIESDFWSGLHQTVVAIVGNDEGRSVVVDPHAGLVIVRAMPGELRDVGAYLDHAEDSLQRQVILEAKIIEVTLSDSFQSGIDWTAISNNPSSLNTSIGTSGVLDGASATPNFTGDVTASTALPTPATAFGNLFAIGASSSNFSALIQLLSTQGEVQVLSSPRISTVNNQKAVIKVGSDEFFVTNISSSTSSNSSSTTTTPEVTLTPFFSGIALDVTPQISENDDVILHVHPSVSEVVDQVKVITVGGQTQQLPLALSTVRESDSVVKAKNGQVVVIGGLMQNSSSNEDAGLPGLSDIPIIGNLFKQKKRNNTRSELVILLRPIVVNSNKTWSNYIKDSAGRIKQLKNQDPSGNE